MRKTSSTTSSRGTFYWLAILAVFFALFGTIIKLLDNRLRHFYIFDQAQLHDISRAAIAKHGNATDLIFDEIVSKLGQDPKIGPTLNKNSFRDPNEWVFNNAGGAMGSMYIIHASITEYLIFFGTPIGTEGHTGRHTADDYFHILQGEQLAFRAGDLTPERYPAGAMHYLKRGQVKQYVMPESGCWALELAQGWIPPMLPFGMADSVFSTLDLPTFLRTCVITGREMIANLLRGTYNTGLTMVQGNFKALSIYSVFALLTDSMAVKRDVDSDSGEWDGNTTKQTHRTLKCHSMHHLSGKQREGTRDTAPNERVDAYHCSRIVYIGIR